MESDDNDDNALLCSVITGFINVIASFDDDDIFLCDMPKSLMITGLIDVIALDDTTMTKPEIDNSNCGNYIDFPTFLCYSYIDQEQVLSIYKEPRFQTTLALYFLCRYESFAGQVLTFAL